MSTVQEDSQKKERGAKWEDGHDQGSNWEVEESIMFNLEMLLQKVNQVSSGIVCIFAYSVYVCLYRMISNIQCRRPLKIIPALRGASY